VITNHWHGISFYGAINCKIINNTVVDNVIIPSPDPWIMVHDHKNGTPSSGVIVRNNISTDFSLSGGVTEDHNIEFTMNEASTYFINPSGGNGDYHSLVTSPAIDAGSGASAPNIDKDGLTRPQGNDFDIGAYEYNTINSVEENISPSEFILYQNYPNPFNPSTKIEFRIADFEFVNLKVYDILGNEVATLVNENKPTGSYEVIWFTENLPSGVYFYRLQAGQFNQIKKMVLVK
jgi:hypothetical protein